MQTTCRWEGCRAEQFESEEDCYMHVVKEHAQRGRQNCKWFSAVHVCNRPRQDRGQLKEHLICHFSNVFKPIICIRCYKKFRNRQDCRKHIAAMHDHENPTGENLMISIASAQMTQEMYVHLFKTDHNLESSENHTGIRSSPPSAPPTSTDPPAAKRLKRYPDVMPHLARDGPSSFAPRGQSRNYTYASGNYISQPETRVLSTWSHWSHHVTTTLSAPPNPADSPVVRRVKRYPDVEPPGPNSSWSAQSVPSTAATTSATFDTNHVSPPEPGAFPTWSHHVTTAQSLLSQGDTNPFSDTFDFQGLQRSPVGYNLNFVVEVAEFLDRYLILGYKLCKRSLSNLKEVSPGMYRVQSLTLYAFVAKAFQSQSEFTIETVVNIRNPRFMELFSMLRDQVFERKAALSSIMLRDESSSGAVSASSGDESVLSESIDNAETPVQDVDDTTTTQTEESETEQGTVESMKVVLSRCDEKQERDNSKIIVLNENAESMLVEGKPVESAIAGETNETENQEPSSEGEARVQPSEIETASRENDTQDNVLHNQGFDALSEAIVNEQRNTRLKLAAKRRRLQFNQREILKLFWSIWLGMTNDDDTAEFLQLQETHVELNDFWVMMEVKSATIASISNEEMTHLSEYFEFSCLSGALVTFQNTVNELFKEWNMSKISIAVVGTSKGRFLIGITEKTPVKRLNVALSNFYRNTSSLIVRCGFVHDNNLTHC